MDQKDEGKNGSSFWWKKGQIAAEESRRSRFRKFESVKELLENIQKPNGN